jgi:hypothetical protein
MGMSIPTEVLDLENQSLGQKGAPTLAAAFEMLLPVWRAGSRDREVGLHLMFLAWYLMCEPGHLTGLESSRIDESTPGSVFREVHDYLRPSIKSDAEMLYVVGLMAHLFPYLLGDEPEWESIAAEYRESYRALVPEGLSPNVFAGRGAYGDYFAGQTTVVGGY